MTHYLSICIRMQWGLDVCLPGQSSIEDNKMKSMEKNANEFHYQTQMQNILSAARFSPTKSNCIFCVNLYYGFANIDLFGLLLFNHLFKSIVILIVVIIFAKM